MIEFLTEGVECPNLDRSMIDAWVAAVAKAHGKYPGNITYVFCSDDYILQTNREFLQTTITPTSSPSTIRAATASAATW